MVTYLSHNKLIPRIFLTKPWRQSSLNRAISNADHMASLQVVKSCPALQATAPACERHLGPHASGLYCLLWLHRLIASRNGVSRRGRTGVRPLSRLNRSAQSNRRPKQLQPTCVAQRGGVSSNAILMQWRIQAGFNYTLEAI